MLHQSESHPHRSKLPLRGFNNLTKSLSFNIYDISYAPSKPSRRDYLAYINQEYNGEKLKTILEQVVRLIGAHVINLSTQDYEPLGASAAILMAEEAFGKNSQLLHLDKSHISAHTYPESDDHTGISTFRVDIDVGTCGKVSPLKVLDFLVDSFDSDVVIMDYRVRGFTRDTSGNKLFIDHQIHSIADFIDKTILNRYRTCDMNVHQENIFHTKMILKDFNLNDYLFDKEEISMSEAKKEQVRAMLKKEMDEIFHSKHAAASEF